MHTYHIHTHTHTHVHTTHTIHTHTHTKVVEIPAGSLMQSAKAMHLYPELGLEMEGYPNRDSTQYGTVYGLAGVQTLLRGTLRYKVPVVAAWWCTTRNTDTSLLHKLTYKTTNTHAQVPNV